MNKYEHTTAVLHFDKKNFATSSRDVLQGLAPASASELNRLGGDGWELVSVVPYVSGSSLLLRTPATDAALAFFKRAKG